MKYEDWLQSVSEYAMKKLLKTVDKILDDADDQMTSTEIDNIKNCFNAISMVHYLLSDHSHCHQDHSASAESVDANMTKNLALRT